MKDKKEKNNFIKGFINSIKSFDFYKKIYKEDISNSFKYFFKLMLIYTAIITVYMGIIFHVDLGKLKKFIQNDVNSLSYSNGVLNVNDGNEISILHGYGVINTSDTENEYLEKTHVLVIGKDSISINSNNSITKIKYSEFLSGNLSKQDIAAKLELKNNITLFIIFVVIIFISIFLVFCISNLIELLIIALFGFITARIIKCEKVGYKQAFTIAVHAITLPIVLSMVDYGIEIFTKFSIKQFSFTFTLISTIYVITSVYMITAEEKEQTNKPQ